MSLLGRLEDLSLPDIVQIVFLSRRTGVLEILEGGARSTILFDHGLIVSASTPFTPDLLTFLGDQGLVDEGAAEMLRHTAEAGIPPGVAVLEMNLVSADVLGELVQKRITAALAPLLDSRDGEFNFLLMDALSYADLEYDPKSLFPQGGVQPQKVLGAPEGEKLKPLKGLEDSLRAGKELLRSTQQPRAVPDRAETEPPAVAAASPASFDELEDETPFGELDLPADTSSEPLEGLVEPEGSEEEVPEDVPLHIPTTPEGLFDEQIEVVDSAAEQGGTPDRHVILFERSPLLRVAARRAFQRAQMTIEQFGDSADVEKAIEASIAERRPFVTILELEDGTDGRDAFRLLERIRNENPLLPVVMMDHEPDLRRRARLLDSGADHYITRPSEAHLQPALADEQLAIFADELVRFAEFSFSEIEEHPDAPPEWRVSRPRRALDGSSNEVLKHLINELSNPNDLDGMVAILLRLATQYMDRAAVLMGRERFFVGLGGAGEEGLDERVREIRISYAEPSVIAEVASGGESHIGKLRRTSGNEALIRGMGEAMPSRVAVLPIRNRERVVAVLYGDNALAHEPFEDLAGLELFLEQAGFALENAVIASSRRGAQA